MSEFPVTSGERESVSYGFVDRMMEQNNTGELRWPVSETLDMRLVELARAGGRLVWAESQR